MLKKLFTYILIALPLLLICLYSITNPVFSYPDKLNYVIDADSIKLKEHVNKLTHTSKPRNNYNVQALNEAADYISSQLKTFGYEIEEQKFTTAGNEYKNILCSYGPKNAERLIVGAHYDVCGDQPGADDNASGIAGLLELARLLQLNKPQLNYRIDLVAYTLEEPPNFKTQYMGSAVHAKFLHDNKIKVKAMVCLEMIGYFSEKPKSQEYPVGFLKLFYPKTANFITVVGKTGQGSLVRKIKRNMQSNMTLDVRSINAPKFIPGIDFSDHLNYWKYDYPAVMITNTAFYRNKNYHEKSDTPETLDVSKMTEVVKGSYAAIINFVK